MSHSSIKMSENTESGIKKKNKGEERFSHSEMWEWLWAKQEEDADTDTVQLFKAEEITTLSNEFELVVGFVHWAGGYCPTSH